MARKRPQPPDRRRPRGGRRAGPAGARPRGRRGRRREAARRVEALLGQAAGRPDDSRDHRNEQRWLGHRTLDVRANRELFDGLVALDFDYLMGQRFAAGQRILADLLPQSVVGRAQNGHGWFTDEFGTSLRFPDATFERVLSVLEHADPNLRGHAVRRRRGLMLRRFGEHVLDRLAEPELELAVDGQPALGVDFLAGARVDTRAFLAGMVLAGHMDDWHQRRTSMLRHKRTFGGYAYEIGGGEIVVVDREKFLQLGLMDPGRRVFLPDELRDLRDLGVISDGPKGNPRFPGYDQVFFRRRLGDGVCDDLAMLLVGARHGYAGMMGAFLMDAIDTYDKHLLDLTPGGYDGWLAAEIQRRFLAREGRPLVGDEEILDLIHFAAKRNDPPLVLSSSHRRLIQYEKGSAVPTVLNHWQFLQGEPVHEIKLGYSRVPARDFYAVARARLAAVGHKVPEPVFIREKRERR